MTSNLTCAALHGREWSSLGTWCRGGTGLLWGALVLLIAGQASASPVIVLAQPQVPQYAQVVAGVHAVRSGDEVVDLADEAAVSAYWQRRRSFDSDLWVVELNIADAERFAAETMTVG